MALAAILVSLLLQMVSFYFFLIVGSAKGVDNMYPRQHRPTDSTLAGRLYAAHLNQAESFPGLAASVLASVATGNGAAAAPMAWVHIFFRVLYWFCYAFNLPSLRTVTFVCGFDSNLLIFLKALR